MKLSKEDIINKFKKQHRILQILDIVIIALLIKDAISMHVSQMTIFLVCLAITVPVFQELFKKEED